MSSKRVELAFLSFPFLLELFRFQSRLVLYLCLLFPFLSFPFLLELFRFQSRLVLYLYLLLPFLLFQSQLELRYPPLVVWC